MAGLLALVVVAIPIPYTLYTRYPIYPIPYTLYQLYSYQQKFLEGFRLLGDYVLVVLENGVYSSVAEEGERVAFNLGAGQRHEIRTKQNVADGIAQPLLHFEQHLRAQIQAVLLGAH